MASAGMHWRDVEKLHFRYYPSLLNYAETIFRWNGGSHYMMWHDCKSVAFPLISSGVYGYPKDDALRIATTSIQELIKENDINVFLVLFDSSAKEEHYEKNMSKC